MRFVVGALALTLVSACSTGHSDAPVAVLKSRVLVEIGQLASTFVPDGALFGSAGEPSVRSYIGRSPIDQCDSGTVEVTGGDNATKWVFHDCQVTDQSGGEVYVQNGVVEYENGCDRPTPDVYANCYGYYHYGRNGAAYQVDYHAGDASPVGSDITETVVGELLSEFADYGVERAYSLEITLSSSLGESMYWRQATTQARCLGTCLNVAGEYEFQSMECGGVRNLHIREALSRTDEGYPQAGAVEIPTDDGSFVVTFDEGAASVEFSAGQSFTLSESEVRDAIDRRTCKVGGL